MNPNNFREMILQVWDFIKYLGKGLLITLTLLFSIYLVKNYEGVMVILSFIPLIYYLFKYFYKEDLKGIIGMFEK